MLHSEDAIREEIAALRDQKAALRARSSQIGPEIEGKLEEISALQDQISALQDERHVVAANILSADERRRSLERVLSLLEEQHAEPLDTAEGEDTLVVPDAPPVAGPSAPPPGTPHKRAKPDPTKAAKKAARQAQQAEAEATKTAKKAARKATGRRNSTMNPLEVRPNAGAGVPKNMPCGTKRPRLEDREPVDLATVTPVWFARADAVALLLEEYGDLSQWEIGQRLPEVLDTPPVGESISPFVSTTLDVLRAQKRVIGTHEKRPTRPGGRAISKVWKIRTPVNAV